MRCPPLVTKTLRLSEFIGIYFTFTPVLGRILEQTRLSIGRWKIEN